MSFGIIPYWHLKILQTEEVNSENEFNAFMKTFNLTAEIKQIQVEKNGKKRTFYIYYIPYKFNEQNPISTNQQSRNLSNTGTTTTTSPTTGSTGSKG